jgi:hypothetical protein
MDLVPALKDMATGLIVAVVLVARYGPLLPGWRPEMEPATPSPGVKPCEVGNPPRP